MWLRPLFIRVWTSILICPSWEYYPYNIIIKQRNIQIIQAITSFQPYFSLSIIYSIYIAFYSSQFIISVSIVTLILLPVPVAQSVSWSFRMRGNYCVSSGKCFPLAHCSCPFPQPKNTTTKNKQKWKDKLYI